jgi:hypothetical protein
MGANRRPWLLDRLQGVAEPSIEFVLVQRFFGAFATFCVQDPQFGRRSRRYVEDFAIESRANTLEVGPMLS